MNRRKKINDTLKAKAKKRNAKLHKSNKPKYISKAEQAKLDKAMDKEIEIQAAVFRRLLAHLDNRKDVQNIELMNLAGFCRNCFSKWTVAEAEKLGVEVDIETAREQVYGMPYSEWKEKHQLPATEEQLAKFNELNPKK